MKEYFVGVMAAVLFGGLIISLFPDGSEKKYLRLLCAIAAVSCMIVPLIDFASDAQNVGDELDSLLDFDGYATGDYDEFYNNSLMRASVDNAEKYLKKLVISEVDAKDEDLDIDIIARIESDEIYIEAVEVKIYPSGLAKDPHAIEKLVCELLGCECRIFYISDEKNN